MADKKEIAQLHLLHKILAKRDGKSAPGIVVPGTVLLRAFKGKSLPSGKDINPTYAYELLEEPKGYRGYQGITPTGQPAWLTFSEYRRRIMDRARDAGLTVDDESLKLVVRVVLAVILAVCTALVTVLATPAAGAAVAAGGAAVDQLISEKFNPKKVGV